ncbi:hypothetical protein NCC49_000458 [Naganishia albida]|nr:hypothetical protein NCC49_000458 [Naganishia albida]
MKFSIIIVAAAAAIFGQASPVPQDSSVTTTTTGGGACPDGLKVLGFARLDGYEIRGFDFSDAEYAAVRAEGKYDNFGGPVIGGALIRSNSLPGQSEAFVQAKNANYFFHKRGSASSVVSGLSPNSRYDTYIQGTCAQFASNPTVFSKCCQ